MHVFQKLAILDMTSDPKFKTVLKIDIDQDGGTKEMFDIGNTLILKGKFEILAMKYDKETKTLERIFNWTGPNHGNILACGNKTDLVHIINVLKIFQMTNYQAKINKSKFWIHMIL